MQRSQSNIILDAPQNLLSPPNSQTSNESSSSSSSVDSTPPITPNVISFKGTSLLKDDFTSIDIAKDLLSADEKDLQDFKIILKKRTINIKKNKVKSAFF